MNAMTLQSKRARKFALILLLIGTLVPSLKAQVAVGDILCEGDVVMSPGVYTGSGATAIGVVFYVDGTGQHGWAVALQDAGSFSWGPNNNDTPLGNYTNKREAIYDLNGYQNTQVVRQCGTNYPAFYAVDFENGWYVPAIGQLNYLYGNLVEVNASLERVGGTPFSMDGDWRYWSSTEYSAYDAWSLYSTGELSNYIDSNHKDTSRRVRGVRAF